MCQYVSRYALASQYDMLPNLSGVRYQRVVAIMLYLGIPPRWQSLGAQQSNVPSSI